MTNYKYNIETIEVIVSKLYFHQKEYEKSAQKFNEISINASDKYGRKNRYILSSILCTILSDDIVASEKLLQTYILSSLSFKKSIECDIASIVIESAKNKDLDLFMKCMNNEAKIIIDDPFFASSLSKIKDLLYEEDDFA